MKTPSKNLLTDDTNYIPLEEVILIHERMLEVGGGRKGIRDFTLIHSAVERPKATFSGKSLYPDLWLKSAALTQSLIKNHPFEDGNKRTAYFSTLRFLFLNNYLLKARKAEIVKFTLNVYIKILSIKEISVWLKNYSYKIRA